MPDELRFSDSIIIDRTPDEVYDLVSDVTRTGEWSPICAQCWWDDGAGPEVGAWFTGRNITPTRTWETRSQVVAAERGVEFAWKVSGRLAYWRYTMAAVDGGTELTESWEFGEETVGVFGERYGADTQQQIEERTAAAYNGIPVTLAAIKRIAESG